MQHHTRTHRILILSASLLLGIVFAAVAAAGGPHCGRCGGTAAGESYPCADAGCGPRYCGPWHGPCDPCDGCNRWVGANGARQGPELLAPWQLPPGRGFTAPADLGYQRPIGVCGEGGPCAACDTCPPHHCLGWLRPASWF